MYVLPMRACTKHTRYLLKTIGTKKKRKSCNLQDVIVDGARRLKTQKIPAVGALEIPEVLLHIFSYLGVAHLVHRVGLVCIFWRELSLTNDLWRRIFCFQFNARR